MGPKDGLSIASSNAQGESLVVLLVKEVEDLLKLANAVGSGGEAKILIQEGEVRVNGETCTMRGKKIRPGDVVSLPGLEIVVQ